MSMHIIMKWTDAAEILTLEFNHVAHFLCRIEATNNNLSSTATSIMLSVLSLSLWPSVFKYGYTERGTWARSKWYSIRYENFMC